MALTNIFTGADGTLDVAVAGTDTEAADFTAITDAYSISTIGRVTDVEVCVKTDLEEFYEIGKRDPQTLHPGNVHISGKIGRAYINGALLFLLLGRGAKETLGTTTVQPRFVLNLTMKDPAEPTNTLRIKVFGVRFQDWSVHLPQNDFVMEQVIFKASTIASADTEASTDINVAFPEAT
jgi:hypothetical protein